MTHSEQLGVECSTTPTTMIIKELSIVQADTLTPITPPDSTSPSQHQQGFILDDTNKDSFNPKAKKTLDFTDTHSENLHLKLKALILDEKDEPPAKRKKNDLCPPSELHVGGIFASLFDIVA
ncbi:hypothetical protein OIU85_029028 [Salix viminalis]|uniref:Uncharacterized protein n=1 Tax=Salix viminalis TaxID=40686 RepID=A0A9Q0QAQ2_SALVM|nr:hypothetical protein OIU85_029028 [Salix viminalis]